MSLNNVVGQGNIAEMLSKSLEYNRISHAYIFAGPKGVGKAKMALELAKAINCIDNPVDSCDKCQNCRKIEHFNHPDVIWIKPDGNSIKIDQIRELQRDFHYKASGSKYKVFVIENAELMTIQAANSLLKFLEEPNSHTVAILLVENYNQLLATIKSRCQTLLFSHIDPYDLAKTIKSEEFKESDILIASHLTQNIDEVKSLATSEQFAQMRNIMIEWNENIRNNNYQALFSINDKIMKNDYIKEQLPQFLDLLIIWYRDILNIKLNRKSSIVYKDFEDILSKQALHITELNLIDKIELIIQAKKKLSSYVNPQVTLEELVLSLWEG